MSEEKIKDLIVKSCEYGKQIAEDTGYIVAGDGAIIYLLCEMLNQMREPEIELEAYKSRVKSQAVELEGYKLVIEGHGIQISEVNKKVERFKDHKHGLLGGKPK